MPAGQRPVAAGGKATAGRIRESEEEEDLTEVAARNAPPWLLSALVHMVLLVALGLWVFSSTGTKAPEIELVVADEIGEQLEEEDLTAEMEDSTLLEEEISQSELPEVEDPFAAPPELEVDPFSEVGATSDISAPSIGMALDGRQEGMKQGLMATYGGDAKTESAVQLGLAWLARQQRPGGSWSLKGPYSDGGGFENTAAATAMAMLAFQGNGNTHQKGKYKENVRGGMEYLLQVEDDGSFFADAPSSNRFYTQGQCTIAICELYAMSKDPKLKDVAQRAVAYCVKAQDPDLGGWRYNFADDSDTSVTGWIVMALQSAKMGGLDVPQPTLDKIGKYLDRAGKEGGSRYSYTAGADSSIPMTAEGLLCRQYLGWDRDNEALVRGANSLVSPENLPSWNDRNVYYWYYATQVLHHMEGENWKTWNTAMKKELPSRQEKRGPEKGSWHPTEPDPDRWGYQGGRLFVTCLSIYMLEVYYRHLPIYSSL